MQHFDISRFKPVHFADLDLILSDSDCAAARAHKPRGNRSEFAESDRGRDRRKSRQFAIAAKRAWLEN